MTEKSVKKTPYQPAAASAILEYVDETPAGNSPSSKKTFLHEIRREQPIAFHIAMMPTTKGYKMSPPL